MKISNLVCAYLSFQAKALMTYPPFSNPLFASSCWASTCYPRYSVSLMTKIATSRDIDLDEGKVRIVREIAKNRKEREPRLMALAWMPASDQTLILRALADYKHALSKTQQEDEARRMQEQQEQQRMVEETNFRRVPLRNPGGWKRGSTAGIVITGISIAGGQFVAMTIR
jgi:hypothetical protein